MDILRLLELDGYKFKKMANTKGGEYAGSCPWCGGDDRFRVWPNNGNGRYWCRQCNKSGDNIQYLRDFKRLSYKEACEYLRVEPKQYQRFVLPKRKTRNGWIPKTSKSPEQTWQARAKNIVDQACAVLHSNTGEKTRKYLHDRGIDIHVMKDLKLGYNSKDQYFTNENWGLPEKPRDNGKAVKVWIPAGVVIPYYHNKKLIRLRIRRETGEPRYVVIPGSDTRPMLLGLEPWAVLWHRSAVIVESELDAIMMFYKVDDCTGIVALGSAQAKPDTETHEILKKTEKILVSLDYDEAGAGYDKWWTETYAQAEIWPTTAGKDPGEAYQAGMDIRSWIKTGLPVNVIPPI